MDEDFDIEILRRAADQGRIQWHRWNAFWNVGFPAPRS